MRRLIDLVKGFPGHPSHPPLTDASIGAYTVGAIMLVLGALGLEEQQMAHGGLLAISGGLILAAPTAITGLLDWLDLPQGTPARKLATIHLFTMVAATVVFAGAWLLQRPGYLHGTVKPGGWIAAVGGELLLAAGGYMGGTLVFVYAHRVTNRPRSRLAQALIPGAEPPVDRQGIDDNPVSQGAPANDPAARSRP
jgi:uncharacterized membrane protein